MIRNKFIITLMAIILIIPFSQAVVRYSLEENQWGQPYVGYDASPNDILVYASTSNHTVYIPFTMPKTGYISQIKWLTGSLDNPGTDTFIGAVDHVALYKPQLSSLADYYLETTSSNPQPAQVVINFTPFLGLGAVSYPKEDNLYIIISGSANSNLMYAQANTFILDKLENELDYALSPILPMFYDTNRLIDKTFSTGDRVSCSYSSYWNGTDWIDYRSPDTDGICYVPFVEVCIRQSPTGEDFCYSLSTRADTSCLEVPTGGFGSANHIGNYFKYTEDNSSVNAFYPAISVGSNFDRNSSAILLRFYELDDTLNVTSVLYEKRYNLSDSAYSYMDGYSSKSNITFLEMPIYSPFNINHDQYYAYTIKAIQGFSCCTDCLHAQYIYDTFGVAEDRGGWMGTEVGGFFNRTEVDDQYHVIQDYFDFSWYLNLSSPVYINETTNVTVNQSECNDTIDNDGDGFIDYPADPSCDNASDDSEAPIDTAECNDGSDNDGDGYIDYPQDPSCNGTYDNTEAPADDPQCDDTLDNDGDGFTDFPDDPSCSSFSDITESPFDNPQCNDGIDNDLDGFIDYPDDPSCSGVSDTTEDPADNTTQEEDDCLDSLNCLIYDSIPYSDSPFLHGWYGGLESDSGITTFLGGYSFDLDTVDDSDIYENVEVYYNIVNQNNYNELYGQFIFAVFDESGLSGFIDEPLYFGFYDLDDNPLITAVINFTAPSSPTDLEGDLYVNNGGSWEYVSTVYLDDSDNGYIKIEFDINQQTKEFEVTYTDFYGTFVDYTIYDFENFGSIYKAFINNYMRSDTSQTLLNLVELRGTDQVDLETFCTDAETPYHLVENFNGYMSQCSWNIDPDLFFYGVLSIPNELNTFYAYKLFDDESDDAIYYDRVRYATVTFDYTFYDDSESGTNMNLYLYDLAFTNSFARISFKTNGSIDVIESGDTRTIYNSMVPNVSKSVLIVVDLIADNYDFYYDGSLVERDIGFYNEFLNLEYFNGLYIQSGNSNYKIDNLEVYESESDGDPSSNIDVPVNIPDEDYSMCGLFSEIDQNCNQASDCQFGECLPNGKCAKFDFTWCDENGHTRGNMCVLSGVTSCVLTSAGDIVLDNFFLFLIALIIIMGLVYLAIMMRN